MVATVLLHSTPCWGALFDGAAPNGRQCGIRYPNAFNVGLTSASSTSLLSYRIRSTLRAAESTHKRLRVLFRHPSHPFDDAGGPEHRCRETAGASSSASCTRGIRSMAQNTAPEGPGYVRHGSIPIKDFNVGVVTTLIGNSRRSASGPVRMGRTAITWGARARRSTLGSPLWRSMAGRREPTHCSPGARRSTPARRATARRPTSAVCRDRKGLVAISGVLSARSRRVAP